MAVSNKFFLGFPVDAELESKFGQCSEFDREYLDDPQFLQRISLDGNVFIGRLLDDTSMSVEAVDNSARNVVSLLTRIVPDWSKNPSDAVLTAIQQETIPDSAIFHSNG